ncbi:unnamed protein product [Ilex paraguariensis]|uniref:Polysaccharide biosynthesis domain-containing protein n=1 Tax=Ilex paraguariensis TaxID=185542 RepID=A0ABC8R5G5_9AQUA
MKSDNRHFKPERPWFLVVAMTGLIGGVFLIATFIRAAGGPPFCNSAAGSGFRGEAVDASPAQFFQKAILHYATSTVVPQQSLAEISVSFNVLQSLQPAPCNFLVFGLGHDSLMWSSFNPLGTTLFLEEDPKWVQTVLKDAPTLHAHTVQYRTKLSQADELVGLFNREPDCWPSKSFLRGNTNCKLALDTLPNEVYEREWDLIMIDAPRGYSPELPGRMGAIYSAAVMARNRKKSGVTHVFLHDVDRKVEKAYAEMFLCRKQLVKAVGRLWHFEIPPAANVSHGSEDRRFC